MNNLPNISILTPTFNRRKFLPLYLHNLTSQLYPHDKLEVCIDDDGTEPFINKNELEQIKRHIYPIKLNYVKRNDKRTIGEKRNNLVKKISSNKILCFMDDDDIYNNNYIQYSYNMLIENKVGLVGSNSMLFTYPKKDYIMSRINCPDIVQIHEATMLFTRKYFNSMGGFNRSNRGEGAKFILGQTEKRVFNTDINNVMICVGHDNNSVDKEMFSKEDLRLDCKYGDIDKVLLLNDILELNNNN
tara:strand:+ start:132 stop:863 length:732 start_codon:yes stop_codon:yes gene_type:complete